jgi:hypothetical protein
MSERDGSRGEGTWASAEHRTHRALLVDAPDGFPQHVGHRQHLQLGESGVGPGGCCWSPAPPRTGLARRAARWPAGRTPHGWRRPGPGLAPCRRNSRAPWQMVPPVSIMSSIRIAVLPATSPITVRLSATLWPERRLSMIARGASCICLAKARARATPPTSGETTTISPRSRVRGSPPAPASRRCGRRECRSSPGSGRNADPWPAPDPPRGDQQIGHQLGGDRFASRRSCGRRGRSRSKEPRR